MSTARSAPPCCMNCCTGWRGNVAVGSGGMGQPACATHGLANSIAAAIDQHRRLTLAKPTSSIARPSPGCLIGRRGFIGGWMLTAVGSSTATQSPTRLKCLPSATRLPQFGLVGSPLAIVQHELLDYVLKRDLPLAPGVVNHLQRDALVYRTNWHYGRRTTPHSVSISRVAELRRFYPSGSLADCYWPPANRTPRDSSKRRCWPSSNAGPSVGH